MKEEHIFHDVLQQPADRREAFLDAACGTDLELRERVAVLLQAQANPGSFLQSPALVAPTIDQPMEQIGTIVGRYKLLEQIGEGGMGVVYVAEQTEPVRRRVALKIIKPGMDTKQVIARFEAERQALAMMDHPNIAKILDAGTVSFQISDFKLQIEEGGSEPNLKSEICNLKSSGRPYFVMELVRGLPITEYCDQARLTTQQRLELFIDVCHAVQHAHQKGIIHRDLKPSNVMVTLHDGTPVVKVIDFGVAKAIGVQLTDRTIYTAHAQLVGTPLYMSPEQAELSGLDVDTRSDVYSLGVLLYELLTGTTPFDKETLTKAGFDEMRRIIREEEPETVSARLAKTRRVGSAHHASAPIPHSAFRIPHLSELDWIVMKCLEKDRTRRYESASALARDIERYLNDEPVQACPPSSLYRFRKFARRNKTTLAAGSLIIAALLIGTVVSTWQAIRAERNLVEAKRQRNLAESSAQQAEQQRALAEANYQQAQRQQALAEASYKQARRAVDELFVHIGDDVTLNQPEFQPLRAELLQAALRYYQEFIDTWKDEPAKQAEIAASYRRVADLTQQIGAAPQAASAYQAALALQQKLADEGGDSQRSADLAGTWIMLGRSQQSVGQYADAARSYDEALGIFRALAEKEPGEARYQDGIAVVLNNVGYLSSERGQLDEAVKYHEQSVEIHERLVKDQPEDAQLKLRLEASYSNLGNRLTELRRFDEALVTHNKRLVLLRQLVQQHGPRSAYEEQIGATLNHIGDVYRNSRRQAGWFAQAIASYKEARGIQERLVRDHPTSITAQRNLANTLSNTGAVYRWHKDYADALQACDEGIVLLEKLVGTNPQAIYDLSPLGSAYAEKGRLLVALNRSAEAVASYEKAVASHQRLVHLAPSIERFQRELDSFRQEMERAQNKK